MEDLVNAAYVGIIGVIGVIGIIGANFPALGLLIEAPNCTACSDRRISATSDYLAALASHLHHTATALSHKKTQARRTGMNLS